MFGLNSSSTTHGITKCINTATFPAFERDLFTYLNTHHGLVGADLRNSKETLLEAPGPRPDYNDLRLHAITKLPIAGQRKYQQKDLTAEQTNLGITFDRNTLELTAEAQTRLDNDQDKHDKCSIEYRSTFKELRNHDTDALNVVQSHMGPSAMTEIKISPEYKEWEKLPFECVARTFNFLKIVKSMFSKGNAGEAVDVATDFFKLQQEVDEPHPSAFLERVKDHLPRFIAHFECKTNPGYIKLTSIEVAIVKSGLSKAPANIAGIREHLHLHPTDALDKPSELIDAVLKAHKSGLYPDEPSTQSSAFVSTMVLLGDPTKPYCTNCFKLSKGTACYNNHNNSATPSNPTCNRTQEFTVPPQRGRPMSRSNSPLPTNKHRSRSNSPETARKPPPSLKALQSKADLQDKRELYMGYLDDPTTFPADNSVDVSDCLAFMSVNFPKDINKMFADHKTQK